MGAIVDKNQLKKIEYYVTIGKDEGAKLAIGGSRADIIPGGLYFSPTVFYDASNSMRIAR